MDKSKVEETTVPGLYATLLWHSSENKIVRSQLQPSWETANFVRRMWGPDARFFKVIHNMKPEEIRNGSIVALVYGIRFNVKIRLFSTRLKAQLAIPVLRANPNLTIMCGLSF
jgi:hypothetical protein